MILARRSRESHGPLVRTAAIVGWFLASACNRQLAPAPTPAPVAPNVAFSSSASAGQGQLIVDVVDGPVAVQQVHMHPTPITDDEGRTRYEFLESPEVLCEATPCAVTLPVGNIALGFPVKGSPGAQDVELVHVDQEPTVYRRALSLHEPGNPGNRTLGVVGASLGGMAMTAGAAMLPIGLAKDVDGLTIAGGISLGVGTVMLGLGVWAISSARSTYRPGSALHFSF